MKFCYMYGITEKYISLLDFNRTICKYEHPKLGKVLILEITDVGNKFASRTGYIHINNHVRTSK